MLLQLLLAAVVISSSFGDDNCPDVDPGQGGDCIEECSDQIPCTGGQVCCSNGCGHVCMDPVLDDDDDDDDNDNDECSGGQTRNQCGSPCTATCADPNPICVTVCVDHCECPDSAPIWHDDNCILLSMCPDYNGTCEENLGLEYAECGSACTATCENPLVACTLQCVQRCQCETGNLWHDGRCIEQEECPGEMGDDNCPEVDLDQVGTCVEECNDQNPCTGGKVCCSNGCGHVCIGPVDGVSGLAVSLGTLLSTCLVTLVL